MQSISRIEFLLGQILYLNPVNFPIWIAGLGFLLFARQGKPYRIFGWTYVAVLIVFLIIKSKVYYLGPAYPMLLAAGGVAFEHFFERRDIRWGVAVTTVWLLCGGLLLLPLSVPVFSIAGFRDYAQYFRSIVPNARETAQDYFDMFGWEEMVRAVDQVYDSLDPEEQENCAILTDNYGQAGAIDHYGPNLGLPKALSGHNAYYHWGPGDTRIETLITVGVSPDELTLYCGNIEEATRFSPSEPDVGERNVPICICREFSAPLNQGWSIVRHYD
jgi:hypothetical protein